MLAHLTIACLTTGRTIRASNRVFPAPTRFRVATKCFLNEKNMPHGPTCPRCGKDGADLTLVGKQDRSGTVQEGGLRLSLLYAYQCQCGMTFTSALWEERAANSCTWSSPRACQGSSQLILWAANSRRSHCCHIVKVRNGPRVRCFSLIHRVDHGSAQSTETNCCRGVRPTQFQNWIQTKVCCRIQSLGGFPSELAA